MKIKVFSRDDNIAAIFSKLDKSRLCSVNIRPQNEYRDILLHPEPDTLYYLDITGLEKTDLTRLLKSLEKSISLPFGIIDPHMMITDITELFRAGIIDYLGKNLIEQGITWPRLKKILPSDIFSRNDSEFDKDQLCEKRDQAMLSGTGWENIRKGQEYIFSLMFIELDLPHEWKRKSGKDHLSRIMSLFHDHIERTVSPLSGKIWMWTEYGGIVLFPFDGKSYAPLLSSIRMMMNRSLISAEEYDFNHRLSWRIVHHTGNTFYRPRGDTGTIVSNTVNHLFHMGNQFAEPGNLYITRPVMDLLSPGLKECFTPQGTFEGSQMYRLLQFIPGADGKGAIG